jgi:predicted dehydrogenase
MLPAQLPAPVLYSANSGEPSLRWGVVGPSWIAGEFAKALRANTAQRLVAVSSRSAENGAEFAAAHDVARIHGSVEALVNDPEVDVVYIATTPSTHLEIGLAAVAAGKHVLVEKPFTVSAAEARQLAEAARGAGVLAMEAMWTRYLPQTSVIQQLIADGVLGEIHAVLADHGQAIPGAPAHRLFRPELGGGALLDIGIYTVQFASMVLGEPTSVTAVGELTDTGVDGSSTLVLTHERGAQSTLHSSILARTPMAGVIAGAEATIALDGPFYNPTTFSLLGADFFSTPLTWSDPTGISGFTGLSWEANAFARFAGEGRIESPAHTHAETVSILATIDEARAQLATR